MRSFSRLQHLSSGSLPDILCHSTTPPNPPPLNPRLSLRPVPSPCLPRSSHDAHRFQIQAVPYWKPPARSSDHPPLPHPQSIETDTIGQIPALRSVKLSSLTFALLEGQHLAASAHALVYPPARLHRAPDPPAALRVHALSAPWSVIAHGAPAHGAPAPGAPALTHLRLLSCIPTAAVATVLLELLRASALLLSTWDDEILRVLARKPLYRRRHRRREQRRHLRPPVVSRPHPSAPLRPLPPRVYRARPRVRVRRARAAVPLQPRYPPAAAPPQVTHAMPVYPAAARARLAALRVGRGCAGAGGGSGGVGPGRRRGGGAAAAARGAREECGGAERARARVGPVQPRADARAARGLSRGVRRCGASRAWGGTSTRGRWRNGMRTGRRCVGRRSDVKLRCDVALPRVVVRLSAWLRHFTCSFAHTTPSPTLLPPSAIHRHVLCALLVPPTAPS
ncbi:hypothetical protein B0H15DRAFT_30962 [Mycena belliarum]|uniref:Uncharacterized protein n=1 Tax=Mycena belliarum TaxID=1033014 RepID=A0AAD6XQX5_9AGAR|nr:hypothetical protein B0H15DRAFT_30962 [Mycena belliae]